ncbi:hypothetical protein Tco_0664613 [Tanacetum coccineum]|uniref:Uncharacterized protein n=1 Tax=Tanacetum coccineum TaxID=301880 RepID=A0ABQ4XHK2_9ASTR
MEAGNPLRLDFNFWQTVNYMAVQEADYCGYFYFLQKRVCCMLLAACTSESILLLIILSAGRLVSAGRTIGSAGSYPFCWSYYDSAGSYPFCCERLLSLSCWTICVSAGRTMVLLDSRVHAGGYRSAVDSFLLIRGLDYSCLVGPCHKSRCGFCLVVSILPGVEMYLLLNSLRIAGKSPFSTLKELLHHVNGGHLLYFMDEKASQFHPHTVGIGFVAGSVIQTFQSGLRNHIVSHLPPNSCENGYSKDVSNPVCMAVTLQKPCRVCQFTTMIHVLEIGPGYCTPGCSCLLSFDDCFFWMLRLPVSAAVHVSAVLRCAGSVCSCCLHKYLLTTLFLLPLNPLALRRSI